jgi:hypothetical protein
MTAKIKVAFKGCLIPRAVRAEHVIFLTTYNRPGVNRCWYLLNTKVTSWNATPLASLPKIEFYLNIPLLAKKQTEMLTFSLKKLSNFEH